MPHERGGDGAGEELGPGLVEVHVAEEAGDLVSLNRQVQAWKTRRAVEQPRESSPVQVVCESYLLFFT